MVQSLKLGLIYSKDFFVFSGIITLLSFILFIQLGTSSLTVLIWFKVVTNAVGIFVHHNRKQKEYFFYMNIGLGKRELISYAIISDLAIWIIGITILIKLF